MELKKILVTGANGQLGNELRVLATEACPGCEFLFTDIAELDICNAPAVESYVEQNGADVIIWCKYLPITFLTARHASLTLKKAR